ncbi:MAG: hypothetical protein MZW92_02270 [Comamonadaceae bacterium]|nr:hypothetical protein [Comamonadaceae bacterium]
MADKPMGILFFVWIGIFNYFVIAQFWGFANDLYADEVGKRTFPLVALGATAGGPHRHPALHEEAAGPSSAGTGSSSSCSSPGSSSGSASSWPGSIHRRDVRQGPRGPREGRGRGGADRPRVQEQPLEAGGGFRLVFKSRYLLLIALMIGLYNFVNATGEFIMTDVTVKRSIAASDGRGDRRPWPPRRDRRGGLAGLPAARTESKAIHNAFMDYQFLTNLDRPGHPALPGLPDLPAGSASAGPCSSCRSSPWAATP